LDQINYLFSTLYYPFAAIPLPRMHHIPGYENCGPGFCCVTCFYCDAPVCKKTAFYTEIQCLQKDAMNKYF